MNVSRHFVDIGQRRVQYRRCGSGPTLLMVHQSPRSSAEYHDLMLAWGAHFTCIAPDTPGFGQSDPLQDPEPSIDQFADGLVDLLDALGLHRVAAYGFHSGAIILVTALKRHPDRFSCLAAGGYAVWTRAEMALFSDKYMPPFEPQPYGEHLTWLWNRILEQSWFFPWFAPAPDHRLSAVHDDVARVSSAVDEMLDSGAAYRAGYGAVLRAPRDIPPADAITPPVLITAYDSDPLQPHIDRLGAMPKGWAAHKLATPAEHLSASLMFLIEHATDPVPTLTEAAHEGFVRIIAGGFDGLIHWRGTPGSSLHLHAPGRDLDLLGPVAGMAIDLPGHGLSDGLRCHDVDDPRDWQAIVDAISRHFGCTETIRAPAPKGDPERLFPDLSPDRFGSHLTAAWAIVRAGHVFEPWYEANAAYARDFDPAELDPANLAREHRALLRANAARAYLLFLIQSEGEA